MRVNGLLDDKAHTVSPDQAVTVLVHFAEQLPRLAHVGVVVTHHLIHCGDHSDNNGYDKNQEYISEGDNILGKSVLCIVYFT